MTTTIRSYLVLVRPGERDEVATRLRELPDCEVTPATNRDAIVVVAETPAQEQSELLEERLAEVSGVTGVSLVAGFAGA